MLILSLQEYTFAKLKKLLLILVLVAYASSTIGATVSMHYCMGKLTGTSIGKTKQEKCPKCGLKQKKAKKSCCDNKEQQLKLKAEHKTNDSEFLKKMLSNDESSAIAFYTESNPFLAVTKTTKSFYPNSPPILPKYRLHILYSVYLI